MRRFQASVFSKKGFKLRIMAVGASGTGYRTFLNALCRKTIFEPEIDDPAKAHLPKPLEIKPYETEIVENGIHVVLTILDACNFGNGIDNSHCFDEILNYIEKQFDNVLVEESRIKRNARFIDTRVHALLYFIYPNGHTLSELDLVAMKRFSKRVNVIPVIGKADSMNETELASFKQAVMTCLNENEVEYYNFPYDVEEDDDSVVEENKYLQSLLPFAVAGSTEQREVNGKMEWVRDNSWGTVILGQSTLSDFTTLRTVLLHSHLHALKLYTQDVLYETYRTERFSEAPVPVVLPDEQGFIQPPILHSTVEHKDENINPKTKNLEVNAKPDSDVKAPSSIVEALPETNVLTDSAKAPLTSLN
ncbi:septin Spn7 [Schizosaccharomyces japonicus yFS275]|uniref:Septin Spn7 n=1 Tax=Schizosaccharomyces japonicus (strain yFS275 / FY16936) TaxID=402676 RepID=B6K6X0_SCHJY|nr:septin Spn7 [Schizosaccharomyces japonicus yFS275]EEB09274.2 septin Spn7 [Schizosaccharomyces japonicus yFS275]